MRPHCYIIHISWSLDRVSAVVAIWTICFDIQDLCIFPAACVSYDSHNKQWFTSQNSVNPFVSVTQTPCFCELVAECLNVIFVYFVLRSTSSSTPVRFGWTSLRSAEEINLCALYHCVSLSTEYVLPCEDVWTSSGLAPRIRNIGQLSASRFRRFNLGEMAHLYAFHRKLGSPLWRPNETERWYIWFWIYNSSLRTELGTASSRTPCCYGNWSSRWEVGRERGLTLFAVKIHVVKSSTRPRTLVYTVMRC